MIDELGFNLLVAAWGVLCLYEVIMAYVTWATRDRRWQAYVRSQGWPASMPIPPRWHAPPLRFAAPPPMRLLPLQRRAQHRGGE